MRLTKVLLIALFIATMGIAAIPANAQSNCVNPVTVWDNETLSSIAQREGVLVSELAAANNLSPTARLRIGDVLCLDGLVVAQPPSNNTNNNTGNTNNNQNTGTGGSTQTGNTSGNAQQTEPEVAPIRFFRGQTGVPNGYRVHTVSADDTLFSIAQQYQVTQQNIVNANGIADARVVFVGETLIIPPVGVNVPAPTPPASDEDADAEDADADSEDATTDDDAEADAEETDDASDEDTEDADSEAESDDQSTGTGGTTTAPAVHVPAPGTIPMVAVSPARAQPGDSVTVTGSNFPGNVELTLYAEKQSLGLKSAAIGTTTTNPDGTFSATVVVPQSWSNGSAINQYVVSISAYAPKDYWAMNYFVNAE